MARKKVMLLALMVLALLLLAAGALAQTSPSYNLEWSVIGGGGQPVGSAHYTVNSTAGQGAASPPLLTSAHYAVSGGYWYSIETAHGVYLPVVMRNAP